MYCLLKNLTEKNYLVVEISVRRGTAFTLPYKFEQEKFVHTHLYKNTVRYLLNKLGCNVTVT